MKYGFIGCGNMGGAIARALSRSTKDITLADRSGKGKALAAELGISYSDNVTIAKTCDRIFLAVKPYFMKDMLAQLPETPAEPEESGQCSRPDLGGEQGCWAGGSEAGGRSMGIGDQRGGPFPTWGPNLVLHTQGTEGDYHQTTKPPCHPPPASTHP